mgnify:CR=1 FL=1
MADAASFMVTSTFHSLEPSQNANVELSLLRRSACLGCNRTPVGYNMYGILNANVKSGASGVNPIPSSVTSVVCWFNA